MKRILNTRHKLNGLALLDSPRLLLFEQHLLDFRHLHPNPYSHRDGDDEDNAEHDSLDHAIVAVLHQQDAQVDQKDLLGQGKESSDDEMPELDVACGEDSGREMRRDSGETNDQDDQEAAVASQTRHGTIVEVRALELDGFAAEEVLECEPGTNFTDKGTCCDDGKAYPEAIDDTAKKGDDLVPEKWWEGDDEKDGDWDEPSSRKVADLF